MKNDIDHIFSNNQKCLICGTNENKEYYFLDVDEGGDKPQCVHVECIEKGTLRYSWRNRLIYWMP